MTGIDTNKYADIPVNELQVGNMIVNKEDSHNEITKVKIDPFGNKTGYGIKVKVEAIAVKWSVEFDYDEETNKVAVADEGSNRISNIETTKYSWTINLREKESVPEIPIYWDSLN